MEGGYAGGTLTVPMPVRGWIVNGTYWFDYVFFYAYNGSQVLHFDYQQGAELLPFSEWLQPDEDRRSLRAGVASDR